MFRRAASVPALFVAMSDLHLGTLRGVRWLEARVAQVDALRPDLVVLLGDLFEGHPPPRRSLHPLLGGFAAPLGVWAVPGNHESHGGKGNGMAPVGSAGIQVLDNRWAEVRPGLVLVGVEDPAEVVGTVSTVRASLGRAGHNNV